MPVTSRIDPEKNLIVHTATGRLDVADIREAFDRILEHPDFRPGMHTLWDLRDATVASTPDKLQQLVTHVALSRERRGTHYRLAIVARDSVLLMLADIFKALASTLSFKVKIFRNYETAWNWLLRGNNHGNSSAA